MMNYSVTSSDLRDHLLKYLSRECSLEELEDTFAESLQDYLDSGDLSCVSLANKINALFVEAADQQMDESQVQVAVYQALCPNNEPLIIDTLVGNNNVVFDMENDLRPSYAAPTITEQVNFAAAGTSH